MNNLKIFIFSCVTALLAFGCEEPDLVPFSEVTANFETQLDGTVPTVQFLNTSTGGTTYAWDFGDGNSSDIRSPKHAYTVVGTYQVTLVATNQASGKSNTINKQVVVSTSIIDFENTNVDSIVVFGGGMLTIVDNPDKEGNPSAKVGRMVKTNNQANGGIAFLFDKSLDFSSADNFTAKIYSPRVGARILIRAENTNNLSDVLVAKEAKTKLANAWETLTFDYKDVKEAKGGNEYNRLVILIDTGMLGDGSANFTFNIDDIAIKFKDLSPPPPAVGFDTAKSDASPLFDSITNFEGGVLTIEDNPDTTGNPNKKVAKMVKSAGSASAGSFITFEKSLDFSSNKIFTAKVYSPVAGARILLRAENSVDSRVGFEREVSTTMANKWETLTFDYNGVDGTKEYDRLVFVLNNGALGDGSANSTFYIDDLVLAFKDLTTPPSPFDFEKFDTATTTITNFEGGVLTVEDNPNTADTVNKKVAKMVKNAGQDFAGAFITFDQSIDFSKRNIVTARVLSPRAGVSVLMKAEKVDDNRVFAEATAQTTAANEWETLTFDFGNVDGTKEYSKLVFIFDNGAMGDGSANFTFYIDDIVLDFKPLVPSTKAQIDLPVTFDDTAKIDYSTVDFGGSVTTNAVDPKDSKNQVKKTEKRSTAATFAGVTLTAPLNPQPGFKTVIPLTSAKASISVRVYSPGIGIPILLKVEESGNSNNAVEAQVLTTKADEWETLTFDLSTDGSFDENFKYNKLSMFFNFNVIPQFTQVFYWDDVMLVP